MFGAWFKKTKSKSKVALAIDALNSIELKNFSVYSSDVSALKIRTCRASIVEYIELLNMLLTAFKLEKMLYQLQLPQTIELIYLRDFYIDKKKNYVDVVILTQEFIDKAVEFLTIYEESERASNKTFELEKNLFLTQQVVGNIIILSETFKTLHQRFNRTR